MYAKYHDNHFFNNSAEPQTSNTEVWPKSFKMLVDYLDMSVKADLGTLP